MTAILIAAIVVLVPALFGLGYFWLVCVPRNARSRAFKEATLAATRDYRAHSSARRGSEWRGRPSRARGDLIEDFNEL